MKILLTTYEKNPNMWTPYLPSFLPVFMHCTGGMVAVTVKWIEENKSIFRLHGIELSYDF